MAVSTSRSRSAADLSTDDRSNSRMPVCEVGPPTEMVSVSTFVPVVAPLAIVPPISGRSVVVRSGAPAETTSESPGSPSPSVVKENHCSPAALLVPTSAPACTCRPAMNSPLPVTDTLAIGSAKAALSTLHPEPTGR